MNRLLLRMVPLLLVLCALPTWGWAQKGSGFIDASPDGARVNAAFDAAQAAGIPIDLLMNKLREGQAKNVPMARIADAVEARLAALIKAKELLRRAEIEEASAGDLSVTADAVQVRVEEETIVRLLRVAPAERRTVATAILAQLVQLGYDSERAYGRVTAALPDPEALANLRAAVAAEARR